MSHKKNNTEETSADLTQEQRSIIERVESQRTDWFTIGEESMNDFSLMTNPMDLRPNFPEAAKLQEDRKYVFRWCERTPERVDELTRSVAPPVRWAIVNRQTLPKMAKHVDPVLGCVCCLDQMLLFKPYAHAERVREAKAKMAEVKYKNPLQKLQHDKIDVHSGPDYKINGKDRIEYEDTDDFNGLVVE